MLHPAARPNSRHGFSASIWRSGSPYRGSCSGGGTRRYRDSRASSIFYVTRSADVLNSAAYLARLDQPTPMTRTVMSEIFKDMIRTVCHRTLRIGVMRGAAAVTVRFGQSPDQSALQNTIETLMQDAAVACGEIWAAARSHEFPVSEEERLRGGDRKVEACLLLETLRIRDAETIAVALASRFPQAAVGVYRLLCEIRP
ncbi:MAG: hypothetical protein ACJ8ES_00825 [Xanthobacteraceae bacterium]